MGGGGDDAVVVGADASGEAGEGAQVAAECFADPAVEVSGRLPGFDLVERSEFFFEAPGAVQSRVGPLQSGDDGLTGGVEVFGGGAEAGADLAPGGRRVEPSMFILLRSGDWPR